MQCAFHSASKRNSIVCIDSYEEGVLQGRLYSPFREMETFSSLSQFLLKMEHLLDLQNMPRAYTETRTFSDQPGMQLAWNMMPVRKGAMATFELQILFRQHTSWQGVLCWVGEDVQQQFRSVLELIILLDSALNSRKERVCSGVFSDEQK